MMLRIIHNSYNLIVVTIIQLFTYCANNNTSVFINNYHFTFFKGT